MAPERDYPSYRFHESSDDNDENSFSKWKLYSSSDEDFFKNRSEVLWSRDAPERDYFGDAFDAFSDVTGRTTSSCSWHNDEFDMRSINRVQDCLDAIDDLLYEKKESALISQEVIEECTEWAEKFPYLRLKGMQIIRPVEDSVLLYSSPTKHFQHFPSENTATGLQVEGKKLVIHTPERFLKKTGAENSPDLDKVSEFFEEVIEYDGEYEECLALDESEICDPVLSVIPNKESIATSSFMKTLLEKIADRLALEMWPNVLNALQKVDEMKKCDGTLDFQLPPILTAVERPKFSHHTRPKTEGNGLSTKEFPKLSSILSVSPKILQKKSVCLGSNTQKTRPTSEISLFRRNPTVVTMNRRNEDGFGSSRVTPRKNHNLIHSQDKNVNNKDIRRVERDRENVGLFLPALEGDFNAPSDILRGFHIEPETKDFSGKGLLSAKANEGSAKKQECFLPPIKDKDSVGSNVKLTRNLFTFYGNSLTSDKNRNVGFAICKQINSNSRPNTSSSKKAAGSRGLMEHKAFKDGHVTKNSDCKAVETSARNFPQSKSIPDRCDEDTKDEGSVSLFPIVTSLVPYKEKSYATVKKGLFHAFVGRKR